MYREIKDGQGIGKQRRSCLKRNKGDHPIRQCMEGKQRESKRARINKKLSKGEAQESGRPGIPEGKGGESRDRRKRFLQAHRKVR